MNYTLNDYNTRLSNLLADWNQVDAEELYAELLECLLRTEAEIRRARSMNHNQHADMLEMDLLHFDILIEVMEDNGIIEQLDGDETWDESEEKKTDTEMEDPAAAAVEDHPGITPVYPKAPPHQLNGYIVYKISNGIKVPRGAVWNTHSCHHRQCIICFEEQLCCKLFSCPQCVNTVVCLECFQRIGKCPTCRMKIL